MSARLAPFLQASAFAFRSFPLLLRLPLAFAPLGNKRHHHHHATMASVPAGRRGRVSFTRRWPAAHACASAFFSLIMIFIGTLFCSLLEDAMRLHLQSRSRCSSRLHCMSCAILMLACLLLFVRWSSKIMARPADSEAPKRACTAHSAASPSRLRTRTTPGLCT